MKQWWDKQEGGLKPWVKTEKFRSKIGPGMWECSNSLHVTWLRASLEITYSWSRHEKDQ